MGRIFLTSDPHIGHDREFIWKARGYESVSAMNTTQVQKWNGIIEDDDDVYVLGDVMLGDAFNIEFIKQLKGRIHIVLGNHDTANREKMYRELPNVVEVAEVGIRLKYKKHHFVLTHYPMLTGNLEKESLKQMTLNLYGHTHQLTNFFNDMPFMYHVGVDSHDGIPVLLDDIIEEMYAKVKECVAFLDEEPVESVQPVISQTVIPRCHKCVFNINTCGSSDYFGDCKIYTRDPPDGGFYG